MTQLELPPISFGRYLELLKRRRWQVIPMTFAGLVIGGLVAFFIPRYYVAETTLVYQGQVLDPKARTQADPIFGLIANCERSIPEAIPHALEQLGLIGAREDDPDRHARIEEFEERVEVRDSGIESARGLVNITIEYRDTDGERAADFTNALRRQWESKLLAEFKEQAGHELDQASEEVAAARRAVINARRDLKIHQEDFDLDPRKTDDGQLGARKEIENDLREERRRESTIRARIAGLEEAIRGVQETLRTTDKEIWVDLPPAATDPAKAEAIRKAQADVTYYALAVKQSTKGHPSYDVYVLGLEEARRQLAELVGPEGGAAQPKKVARPNPTWVEFDKQRRERQVELSAAVAELDPIGRRIAELESELEELPAIWQTFEEFRLQYETAIDELDAALAQLREYRGRLERVSAGSPFRVSSIAEVPPAPTEPNITLVALTGCLVGLAAAIGLVLLLDFLRSTFKTVEDVQYLLKMPVLGTMAFLETVEDRRRATVHRRRVSLVAGLFVFLSLSVVTIYYVAPTRLPPAVRDALQLLLGSEQ